MPKPTTCRECLTTGRTFARTTCPTCQRCLYHGHCTCRTCNICGRSMKAGEYCLKCLACLHHHTDGVYQLRATAEAFPFRMCNYNGPIPSFTINALPRAIGIELELTNLDSMKRHAPRNSTHYAYYWDHDGSVTGGLEIGVMPAIGDAYLLSTLNIIKLIHEYGAKADATCGFHVHVDAATLTPAALRRCFVGFAAINPSLYGGLVDNRRRYESPNGVHYCAPCPLATSQLGEFMELPAKSNVIMGWFYKYLYNMAPPATPGQRAGFRRQLNKLKEHKYENAARRHALNFHSWMMRGTLEFRLKEGTTNAADILMWPLWCGWLIDYLAGATDAAIMKWLDAPPTIPALTASWKAAPPSLLQWVEEKEGAKVQPKTPKSNQQYAAATTTNIIEMYAEQILGWRRPQ